MTIKFKKFNVIFWAFVILAIAFFIKPFITETPLLLDWGVSLIGAIGAIIYRD